MDKLRGELTERDNLLIYYAGHGVLDVEADIGFWMSVDAEAGTQADWISIGTITGTVKAMSAKHVMVVSDSCYSGTLTRGIDVSVETGSEREAELRRLAGKRSRTALVSGGLEPVNDGGGDGHSVFTRAFLTALRESTEVLDGQQLFTAVRRPVIVNADQTPEYSDIRIAGHDGGDFLFVPVSLSATAAVTDAPAAQDSGGVSVDMRVWDRIEDSTNAAVFETFIESFPSSPMVPFARIKLEALAGVETALAAPPEPEVPAPTDSAVAKPAVYGAQNQDVRVVIHAVNNAWVQVWSADELLSTRLLRPGDKYFVPNRSDLTLETGNAGALRVFVDGKEMSSIGPIGSVRLNVSLDPDDLLKLTALVAPPEPGAPAVADEAVERNR